MDALYDYEPNRLIRDDAGHIIEKRFARLAYMQARARLVTDDPLDDLRAKAEAEHMAKWVDRESATAFAVMGLGAARELAAGLSWSAAMSDQSRMPTSRWGQEPCIPRPR